MSNYKVGDIVLVKFHPGAGAEFKKYRPAVVMADLTHIDSRFIMVAPFTTNIKDQQSAELLIAKNPILEKDSLLLCWYLRTFDQRRIIKKLGQLQEKEIEACRNILQEFIA
jgi:mRNA-degrading endonuclease toxin of MazEF toxin-antitoxin module